MEVKPAGGRNGDEAGAGTASQAFARRLHHRYAPTNRFFLTTYGALPNSYNSNNNMLLLEKMGDAYVIL